MNSYRDKSSGRKKRDLSPATFQNMAKKINVYLKGHDLVLNFEGYKDTVLRYFRLQDQDIFEVYELMIECNLWSRYMSEVENFIQFEFLHFQSELDWLNACFNKKAPDPKLQARIQDVSQKVKDFSLFYRQVRAQKVFFEKSFWHCFRVYGRSVHTLNFKSLT